MRKFILPTLLAAAAGITGFSAVRYFSPPPAEITTDRSTEAEITADKSTEDASGLKQKVFAFSMDGKTSGGVKQWHLEGKAAEIIDDEIHLEDMNAIVYGEDFTANITSLRGVYRREKAKVELIGDVRCVSEDGTAFTTERAEWSQATRKITTDSVVNIERENMNATGKGAVADFSEKKAILLVDVTVRMEPATLIKCDGPLEVGFSENKAVFSNNVSVTDKDGRLFSDVLTVHFNSQTHKIAKVVAEGDVKVGKGRSYTVCEKATYTDGTRSARFVGRPRVIIAPEELTETGFFSGAGMGK